MAGMFHHESLYRGTDAAGRLATQRITLCGAGAIGSHMADNLARQGFRNLRVIDRDRIEQHNVSTQLYGESDVGAWKVESLRQRLFRATGIEIDAVRKELSDRTAKSMLGEGGVIVDVFDNSASRRLVQDHCRGMGLPCLHVGLFTDYGEAIWDERYRVPSEVGGEVCDYPLARNLILMTVAVASELLVRYILTGNRESRSITLGDFAVRPFD
jgi:molybdopterin/thiamine biosynthesis adenylyltransferase